MRKLSGTTWGANEQILKTVYEGSVRPVLEYSSTAWSTTAKTNQQSLDNIQNQALRIIYRRNEVHTHHIRGANHCYTTSTTETTSKSPSSSREIQVPPRSSHEGEGIEGRTKNRIKRSSLTHEVKKLQKDYPAVLTIPTLPLSKQDFTNP